MSTGLAAPSTAPSGRPPTDKPTASTPAGWPCSSGPTTAAPSRAVLRYAVDDARAVGQVLEDMGGVLPGDAATWKTRTRPPCSRRSGRWPRTWTGPRRTSRRVEVIFYYSGHSDEEALFLGEERVPYAELKDLITSLNADVRIAILDSCASGALTLPKGVIKRPPFLLDTAYDMKGYAFMASSSASEAAQESSRLGRSFFTHNLVSGMRGAADMNLDGRITLNEAYQFAFDGTLDPDGADHGRGPAPEPPHPDVGHRRRRHHRDPQERSRPRPRRRASPAGSSSTTPPASFSSS